MIGARKLPKCRPCGRAAASGDPAGDIRVVAVTGTPEALGLRPESPEALLAVTETPKPMIGAWKVPKCRPCGRVVTAEDSQVVAVTGTPEALGPRPEIPKSLSKTAKVPPAVMETPLSGREGNSRRAHFMIGRSGRRPAVCRCRGCGDPGQLEMAGN